MSRISKHIFIPALCMMLLAAAGCKNGLVGNSSPPANYYINPHKSISALGQVSLVELDNLSSQPQVSDEMTEAIFETMQKRHLFGLTVVHRADPVCKGLPLENHADYSLAEIELMHKAFRTDSVLIGTITQYYPYPRLTMGLRLRLIDLRDGEVIWTLEQLWDSTDKEVEKRIEEFFKTQIRSGYDPLQYRMAIVSPRMFQKFVAYEVGETLKKQ